MTELTPFEQQVAEILTPILAAFDAASGHDHETGDSEAGWFGYPCVCEPDEVAAYLAPRVAAAILAAQKVCDDASILNEGDVAYDDPAEPGNAGLAALRGGA